MGRADGKSKASRVDASWGPVVLFFGANVSFGAGLYFHQLLYNFYLQELGHPESVMGVAAAALSTGGLLALVPAGLAVDRIGIRRAYVAAALVAAAGLALGAVVERPLPVYLAAAVGGGGAAAFRVAMGPAILRLAGPDIRSRAFSWNTASLVAAGAGWTAAAGAVSGALEPFFGGRLGGLRAAMLAGAAITLTAALLAPLALRRLDRPATATGTPATGTGSEDSDLLATLRGLAIPRRLVWFIVAVGVFWAAGALALPFFNLYFEREHALALGSIGVVLGAGQLLTSAAVFASGEGAARAGPGRVLSLWLLFFPPALWGLAVAQGVAPATGFYLLQAFVLPAVYPLVDQILLERAPEDRQGALSAWRNVATEGSGLVGAAAGGALLQAWSFDGLFAVAGGVALVAGLVTIALMRRMGVV